MKKFGGKFRNIHAGPKNVPLIHILSIIQIFLKDPKLSRLTTFQYLSSSTNSGKYKEEIRGKFKKVYFRAKINEAITPFWA